MILVPRSVRVYFATQPTNLRMSFEGLSNAVREVLRQDPLGGHIFVFLNRRKNMVKLLVYTRGGYTTVMKRLEAGTFTFPAGVVEGVASVPIDVHELAMLLEGIEPWTSERASHALGEQFIDEQLIDHSLRRAHRSQGGDKISGLR